jgi:transcriptional regulator with XRE-family HTH domain
MANLKELLAVNLKFSRVRMGFSQKRLADISGLPLSCIKKLEAGKLFPKAEIFERLSEALDRKPCEFLYEGDEWENRDSLHNIAGLHIVLTEKINDLLEQTIHRCLGI